MNFATKRATLLGVPPEIRLNIYEQYFSSGIRIKPRISPTSFIFELPEQAALLLTCRLIFLESRELLWKDVTLDLVGIGLIDVSSLFQNSSAIFGTDAKFKFNTVEINTDLIFCRTIDDSNGLLSHVVPPRHTFRGRENEELSSIFIDSHNREDHAADGITGFGKYAAPVLRVFDRRYDLDLEEDRCHVMFLMLTLMALEFLDVHPAIRVFELCSSTVAGMSDDGGFRALGLMLMDRMKDDSVMFAWNDRYGLSLTRSEPWRIVLRIARRPSVRLQIVG